jgi:hypothetical protein
VVYFILYSVNFVIAGSAIFQWVQCWPLDKLWSQSKPGKCLDLGLVNNYNMFVSGENLFILLFIRNLRAHGAEKRLLGRYGCRLGSSSMDGLMEFEYENNREVGCLNSHEYGNFVSMPS